MKYKVIITHIRKYAYLTDDLDEARKIGTKEVEECTAQDYTKQASAKVLRSKGWEKV